MSTVCCGDGECGTTPTVESSPKKWYKKEGIISTAGAIALFMAGMVVENMIHHHTAWWFALVLYSFAYILVGRPVLLQAVRSIRRGNLFNEFFLMGIATLGAFAIGEYAEGVAVMLFYAVGEIVQAGAVDNAKRSIDAMLKMQAETATLVADDGSTETVHPKNVVAGQTIRVKVGEKVALDGKLVSEHGCFDASAFTGESVPVDKYAGDAVLAGMISTLKPVDILVEKKYADTNLANILVMVREAVSRKAKTERFISKFAKVYTPAVVSIAALLVLVPIFFVPDYSFKEWLYRSLVFLVISCPCALVVSIPLGYFGGIGAASRSGILFKGANYLDLLAKTSFIALDKTGTLTNGDFVVSEMHISHPDEAFFCRAVALLESRSAHPVAQAVVRALPSYGEYNIVSGVEEYPGMGMRGRIDSVDVVVGNTALFNSLSIGFDPKILSVVSTAVLVAFDGRFAGYFLLSDTIKADAYKAVEVLRAIVGSDKVIMLSGDKKNIVQAVATELGLKTNLGDLLPDDKVRIIERFRSFGLTVAFVGDGVNDAPVIAAADIGIAMASNGSDAALGVAGVVIQDGSLLKVGRAIRIARQTRRIVWQNIGFTFGVKIVVLALGSVGIASMWEAVFADVGVTLIAILNAVRIQKAR